MPPRAPRACMQPALAPALLPFRAPRPKRKPLALQPPQQQKHCYGKLT